MESKSIPFFYYLLLGIFYLSSCKKETAISQITNGEVSLIYMVGDNNLSYFSTQDINEMEQGCVSQSQNIVYVYVDKSITASPSHPYLLKIQHDESPQVVSTIIKTYPEQNSCDPIVLNDVLKDIDQLSNKDNKTFSNLVLWSHGNAWLPSEYSIYSERDNTTQTNNVTIETLGFGLDDDLGKTNLSSKEMDIQQLALALKSYHFKTISFDACFMGSIEVAYELRNSTDYLIVSPAEISSTGFPYQTIIPIFQDSANPITIAQSFSNYYAEQKENLNSYTITAINCNAFTNFTTCIKKIHTTYNAINVEAIKSTIQQYDRLNSNYLFDTKHFYTQFLNTQNDSVLLEEFNNTWEQLITYESHSENIIGSLLLSNANGLSCYLIQKTENRKDVENYYKTYQWYLDTSSSSFWN